MMRSDLNCVGREAPFVGAASFPCKGSCGRFADAQQTLREVCERETPRNSAVSVSCGDFKEFRCGHNRVIIHFEFLRRGFERHPMEHFSTKP